MSGFYTYLHARESDGAPFYIGKGRRKDRMKLSSGRSQRWVRTVAKHGFSAVRLADWPTEQEAFSHEIFLIACFRDMGIDLVNHTTGGEGASGFVQSDATKEKRNSKLRGRKKSSETIQRMMAAQAGKIISTEQRARISETLTGRYRGDKNPTARAVVCVDTGQMFLCMTDAGRWLRAQGNPRAGVRNISACITGEKKTAYGFRWKLA